MQRHTYLLLAAGMLAACSNPEPTASPSDVALSGAGAFTAAARHLDVTAPPDVTADTAAAEPPDPSGIRHTLRSAADPKAAAANAVLQLVEDEGLLVLDLNATLTVDAEGSAIVAVRVLFGTGRSHPQEEAYLVRLVEDAGGWAVTDLEVAP